MSRTTIRCKCGQRISQREVMQSGYYPRMSGPSLVFVRYRCSRCKRLGQKYINQEEWEQGILNDANIETNQKEQERFAAMGPIEMQELVAFHEELSGLYDLTEFNRAFAEERSLKQKSESSGE